MTTVGAPTGSNATAKTKETEDAGGGGGLSGFALVFHAMAVMYLVTEAILNQKIDEVEDKLKQVEALRKLQQEGRLQTDTLDQNQDEKFGEAQELPDGIASNTAGNWVNPGTAPCQYLQLDNKTRVLWVYDAATGKITKAEVWTLVGDKWVYDSDASDHLTAGETIQAEDGSLISFDSGTGRVDITRGDQHFFATSAPPSSGTTPSKPVPTSSTSADGETFAAENQNGKIYEMSKKPAPTEFSTQTALYDMAAFQAFKKANPNKYATDRDAFNAFARASVEDGGLGLGKDYQPGVDLTQDLSWRTLVFGDGGNNKGTLSDQIDSLMSMNQLDMLELQKLINQLNFIVTAWTNILKTYFDGLQSVARNM